MKIRLAALALPILLLLPAGASAQTAPITDPTCIVGAAFLLDQPCPTTPVSDAQALLNAQAQWDALADQLGKKVTRQWLGPRPKVVKDLWWMDPTNPVYILNAAITR